MLQRRSDKGGYFPLDQQRLLLQLLSVTSTSLFCKAFHQDPSGESGMVGITALPCTIRPKAISRERELVSAQRGEAGCLVWWWVFNVAKGLVRKRRTKAVPARLRLLGLFSCNLLSKE